MPFKNLPDEANKIWESVYNSSKKAGDSEEIAAKKAWAAVSRGFKKVGETWQKKADFLSEFSMAVTASPFDKSTGEMRWKAVASDTNKDLYNEAMSPELYRSFLDNISKNSPPPKPFDEFVTSDFWKGGMPYLSLSHYPDLNGEGVPGMPESIYMDGKCLKAKGKFFDTDLGRTCWKSLNKDFADAVPEDKRIRISIAFLDLAHRHGNGPIFERKSLGDICKQCLDGVGDKTYINGYLVHLAMTRVPVNPRAEMEVEKSMSKITRKDDAASIVGEEEAKKLDEKAALVGRADVVVEKSEKPMDEMTPEEKKKKKDEEDEATEETTKKKADVVAEVPGVVETPAEVDTVSKVEEPAPVETPLPETSNPNPPEPTETPIDVEVKSLVETVMKVRSAAGTKEEKMEVIRPVIEALGLAIDKALTVESSEVTPATPPQMTPEMVKAIIAEQNQPILDVLSNIQASLASVNQVKSQVIETKVPKPRSPDPLAMRNLLQKVTQEAKPNSILAICRKSVGIEN